MKLAICFYGQPRFYETGHSLNTKMYSNCDIDYYAHFWGNENDRVSLETFFQPKKMLVEEQVDKFKDIPCDVDLTYSNRDLLSSISPLYSMQRLNSIISAVSDDYDFWILTRTDICQVGEFSLSQTLFDKSKIYASYVSGSEWLTTHIDCKFVMGSKNAVLKLTNVYNELEDYLCVKKIKLCHHRLFYAALIQMNMPFEMIQGDKGDGYVGGWRFLRNNQLSIS